MVKCRIVRPAYYRQQQQHQQQQCSFDCVRLQVVVDSPRKKSRKRWVKTKNRYSTTAFRWKRCMSLVHIIFWYPSSWYTWFNIYTLPCPRGVYAVRDVTWALRRVRVEVPRGRALRPAGRCSMSTVIIVCRGTVISCDVVTQRVGGRACMRCTSAARHSCSQSVSLWARNARSHVIAGWLFLSAAAAWARLLTVITCATADQPGCHVIATATYTERSPRRPHDRFVYTFFISQWNIFCKMATFIFLYFYIIISNLAKLRQLKII